MANPVLVGLILAGAVVLNAYADQFLLRMINVERARRSLSATGAHGLGDGGPLFVLKVLLEISLGVGLVLFGIYALIFPENVFIEAVNRLEGIASSIALAITGPPLILAGWWESLRPPRATERADGGQGRP